MMAGIAVLSLVVGGFFLVKGLKGSGDKRVIVGVDLKQPSMEVRRLTVSDGEVLWKKRKAKDCRATVKPEHRVPTTWKGKPSVGWIVNVTQGRGASMDPYADPGESWRIDGTLLEEKYKSRTVTQLLHSPPDKWGFLGEALPLLMLLTTITVIVTLIVMLKQFRVV